MNSFCLVLFCFSFQTHNVLLISMGMGKTKKNEMERKREKKTETIFVSDITATSTKTTRRKTIICGTTVGRGNGMENNMVLRKFFNCANQRACPPYYNCDEPQHKYWCVCFSSNNGSLQQLTMPAIMMMMTTTTANWADRS